MIRIVTDSTASIPNDVAQENNIEVVSLYLNYQGREYEDATMDIDAFYKDIYDMIDDIPTSSQPSPSVFEKVFEQAAAAGDDVLGIFMSADMSGTVDLGSVPSYIDLPYWFTDPTSEERRPQLVVDGDIPERSLWRNLLLRRASSSRLSRSAS